MTLEIISRAGWGARAPRSRETVSWSKRTGFMGHYSAASASQTVREIQNFHMDTRGWSDIGYNFLINSVTGKVYEGRGWTVLGAHCKGYNTPNIGVCVIGKDRAGIKDVSDAARRSFKALYEEAQERKGGKLTLLGHRDHGSTDCPGDELYAWIHAGLPIVGQPTNTPGKPSPSKPAPGPAVGFPLPSGYYFGPASGGDRSVSGRYERRFAGKTDRAWLAEFAQQLSRRGWSVGKGRTYLGGAGNDGIYGSEYATLIKAFQKDQKLTVDGLLGKKTWDAAYHNALR